MDRLQEIKQRLDNVTSGVWRAEYEPGEDICIVSDGVYICQTSYDQLSHTLQHNVAADAKFIAHAKEDIKYLLSLCGALQ